MKKRKAVLVLTSTDVNMLLELVAQDSNPEKYAEGTVPRRLIEDARRLRDDVFTHIRLDP